MFAFKGVYLLCQVRDWTKVDALSGLLETIFTYAIDLRHNELSTWVEVDIEWHHLRHFGYRASFACMW
jgi:hypothetical protein